MEEIKKLYLEILMRDADNTGLEFYYNKYVDENLEITDIKKFLLKSDEYDTLKRVKDLYLKYLYRKNDKNGIRNYSNRVLNKLNNIDEIENVIKRSDESVLKSKIISQLKNYKIKINNNTLHKIYNLYSKELTNIFSIYQNFLNIKIKEITKFKFIYFDPEYNNTGHYEDMKNCIEDCIDLTYIKIFSELQKYNFNENTLHVIYVYALFRENNLFDLINFINNFSNYNIKFYINVWDDKCYNILLQIKDLNNVILLSDVNNNLFQDKLLICPPILSNKSVKYDTDFKISKKIISQYKSYAVTWTFSKTRFKSNRWLNMDNLIKIKNILFYRNVKLIVINLTHNMDQNKIYDENGIIFIDNKIKDKSDYLNLCINSKFCIILSNKIFSRKKNTNNYYNFRSSGRATELIKNNVNIVTDFDINKINLTKSNFVFKINNIKDLLNLDFPNNKISNLNYTTWYNYNFKKIINFTNYSILKNTYTIDILGNSNTLKNYNFKNNNIKIGMNVAFRFWEKNNVYPNIYVSLDKVVTKYHANSIHNLILNSPIEIFILDDSYFENYPDDIFLDKVYNNSMLEKTFYLINKYHITTGLFSVRCALIMGFKYLNIYGMEGNYINFIEESEKLKVNNKTILRIKNVVEKNPNYFFDYYQQIGDLYNIPNNDKEYKCMCDYHNGFIVKEKLHKYCWNLLFFDLKKFGINYVFDNYKLTIKNFSF
jgi:hypothetical protein